MNVIKAVRDYVAKMVKLAPGMKVLLLDSETAGIVSMAYSQSDILQEEVYLFERLDTPNREVMAHLKAVCFLRPTEDNLTQLKAELRKPKYGEYFLFFSNAVSNTYLEQLAAADEHEVVQEVNEFFADYFAVNADLFTLNLRHCLSPRSDHWREKLNRMCDGIISCCLSMRLKPNVRFARSSNVTMQIAQELTTRMRSQKSLFSNLRNNPAVVLVLDRKDDPVTPLLLQWTYQAMTHDHLGINNNRVEIAKSGEKKEQLVLSEQDPFYRENMYKNFGDLGIAIKDLVDQYKEKMQINQNIASIEDMKNFVEQYPEFKKLSGNVSKHVKIVEELQRFIQRRQLLTVSELEQELSSHHGHADALNKVKQLLEDSHISGEDALRIVLLYSLRYESTANNELSALVNALASKKNLSPSVLAIFKQLRDYAGEKRRSMDIDLFKNKNLLDIARGQIKRGLMGVTNIYSQNESLIKRVLADLQTGTLSDVAFPYVDPPASKDRPTEVIIFIAGGACYEESVAVYEFNQRNTGINVVLGGNTIHNYKSFIEDVMEYH